MASQARERVQRLLDLIRCKLEVYEEENDPAVLDNLILQLDLLICHLTQLRLTDEVVIAVADSLRTLVQLREEDDYCSGGIQLEIEPSTNPGRPKYCVLREQLQYLILYLNLDCPTVARVLGISLRTLRRRMSEYNLTVKQSYSAISDAELEITIKSLKESYPNAGYRIMEGLLIEKGIRITQSRLREAMYQVDPNGIVVRFADFIHRRRYHVSGPQKLWHIDSNLKLRR